MGGAWCRSRGGHTDTGNLIQYRSPNSDPCQSANRWPLDREASVLPLRYIGDHGCHNIQYNLVLDHSHAGFTHTKTAIYAESRRHSTRSIVESSVDVQIDLLTNTFRNADRRSCIWLQSCVRLIATPQNTSSISWACVSQWQTYTHESWRKQSQRVFYQSEMHRKIGNFELGSSL